MSVVPKILFIADEIPQSINAGSIQFFRLFKDYPIDKLMIIGRKPFANADILKCEYHILKFTLLDRIRTSRFSSYLTDIQALGFFLPRLPKPIKKVAEKFKPDIVISLMQLITFYYPAYHYAKEKKIPFMLFCHDDVEDFARPHTFFKKFLVKLNAKVYQSANKRICISPEMAEAWQDKYKVEGNYLYPVASENIQGRELMKAEKLVNEGYLTIGYAGSLAYGYREGINEIIPTLEKTSTKLKVYRDMDSGIINSTAIEFVGYAKTPEETWSRVIEECDAVILPYSRERRFEKLYRTHFPSKLPEYLALNMPIIINGPEYANGIRYGNFSKEMLTSTSYIELENKLWHLLENIETRTIFSSKNTASTFNTNNILAKFHSILNSVLIKK